MIFIGLGANLDSPRFGGPLATLQAALKALDATENRIVANSGWYQSAPVPVSDQPDYINGVARVETSLGPSTFLDQLLEIEREFGRERQGLNDARVIDLDLLVYNDHVLNDPSGPLVPHPRMHERAFVLLPLSELAPDWIHPINGMELGAMIEALPADQSCRRINQATP